MTALNKHINREREELHRLVGLYGFQDPRSQYQSQLLDRLIIIEQRRRLGLVKQSLHDNTVLMPA